MSAGPSAFDPHSITRPAPILIWYYLVCALATVFGFPFVFLVLFFKYETLKYSLDEEGIHMSWGILFRRETLLTYRRIQDIHVTRNIIERWMGLATVGIQTAAGSSTPEMQIQGILEFDALRDFLYMKMRGARGLDAGALGTGAQASPAHDDQSLVLLGEIAQSLGAIRRAVESRGLRP